MKTGLIVVDVQNDYFTGGAMELVNMDAAAANCASLLEFFRKQQTEIFHIQPDSHHEVFRYRRKQHRILLLSSTGPDPHRRPDL